KHFFAQILLLFAVTTISGQESRSELSANNNIHVTPKLVVGVVVDQMRFDYITRFWPKYGNDGFKKLIAEGFYFKNNHFSYVPTYTGPGHASVYTGAGPETHGIISNNWFDKFERESVYCAG